MNERNRRERESTAHELNRMNEPEWTEEASDKELSSSPLPRATQMELLAPAGGPAPFTAALAGGADAIYCGLGNNFNARRGADNFDDESFARACRQAHLAGARVYVTVNVVVKWDEMQRVLRLIRRAWILGADAFIIQDWGLMAQVRKTWVALRCPESLRKKKFLPFLSLVLSWNVLVTVPCAFAIRASATCHLCVETALLTAELARSRAVCPMSCSTLSMKLSRWVALIDCSALRITALLMTCPI